MGVRYQGCVQAWQTATVTNSRKGQTMIVERFSIQWAALRDAGAEERSVYILHGREFALLG